VCQEFDDGSFAGQIQMVLGFVPIGEKYLYIQFKMPDGQVYTGSVNIIMNEYVDAYGNGIDDNTGISHDTAEQGNGIDIDTSGNTLDEDSYQAIDLQGLVTGFLASIKAVFGWIPTFGTLIGYVFGWLPQDIRTLLNIGVSGAVISFLIRVFWGS
jgi:hypothetical protein